ncbi:hypothetical protein DACRYDRAFT_25259 [Dacryopinax primogenitus]|uniref:Uncharacterized protein n=1 Tax=Dacryopinax primogenitus (strain DJM 731) TaxID=1858805 RepID=M5FNB1_DACPD|nr:uncharacterized protein DACRYDRAFT_25259 [Dacryopinax primogenitus]EJT97135.1 hypothetical protein DACRYDRAFT_25259 [Dacryopinax primogenitus]
MYAEVDESTGKIRVGRIAVFHFDDFEDVLRFFDLLSEIVAHQVKAFQEALQTLDKLSEDAQQAMLPKSGWTWRIMERTKNKASEAPSLEDVAEEDEGDGVPNTRSRGSRTTGAKPPADSTCGRRSSGRGASGEGPTRGTGKSPSTPKKAGNNEQEIWRTAGPIGEEMGGTDIDSDCSFISTDQDAASFADDPRTLTDNDDDAAIAVETAALAPSQLLGGELEHDSKASVQTWLRDSGTQSSLEFDLSDSEKLRPVLGTDVGLAETSAVTSSEDYV